MHKVRAIQGENVAQLSHGSPGPQRIHACAELPDTRRPSDLAIIARIDVDVMSMHPQKSDVVVGTDIFPAALSVVIVRK
jgi:hypothetical protein